MIKLARIAGVALAAIAVSIGVLGIASAQDGTSTPSTSITPATGGGTSTPAVSGTATPADADDPLDVDETPASSTDGSGGVKGDTTAPAAGMGSSLEGGDNKATGLFFIALSVMSAGAAALLLGTQRRTA